MKKKIMNAIRFVLGFLILFGLFYSIGFEKILNTVTKMELSLFLVSIVVYLSFFLVGTFNLKLLVDSLASKVGFFKLLRYYFLSWSIGMVVPGRIGDFSIIYFLKKENIPLGEGAVVPLIDKFITMMVISIISVIGFITLPFFTELDIVKLSLFLFGGVLFVAVIMTNMGRNFIKRYILRDYSLKFKGFSKTFFYFLRKRKRVLLLNFIMTSIRVSIASLVYYTLFLSLGQEISLFYIILIYSIGTILALIPLTPSGLGIREAVSFFLYNQIGIPYEITATVYLTITIYNYFTASLNFLVQKIK